MQHIISILDSYLSELNESQRVGVEQTEGPVMIIAGAGSGKTRVLTHRIIHLINKGVSPFNILALTFTNKAAGEMKRRISQMVGDSNAKSLWMGTFHSVFARILRSESDKLGYPQNFTIYDTQDSQRLVSAIIKEMKLDKDTYKYKNVYSRISSFKNSLITLKVYLNSQELIEQDSIRKQPRIGDIYKAYVARCFKAGAMDFDDLLLKTNELLTRFPEVLLKYQDQFRYIMVDEYQDTNHSQYLIVRALSDRFQNICVVGDDSQSIYSFRGANIKNILNFKNDYLNAKVFRLEQNYRSTKNIVLAANSVIEKNRERLDKNIWTHNDDGNKIKIHRSITDSEEGRFVANSIQNHQVNESLGNSDFAVLYRTNAQSRSIEDALRRKEIPYKIYGGLSFYQRKEIKDVLAYLRLIINPKDEEALVRVINYPTRGIGETTLNKLNLIAGHLDMSLFEVIENINTIKDPLELTSTLSSSLKDKLLEFVVMIKNFQFLESQKDAFELTDLTLKQTGLIREYKKDTSPEGIAKLQNIEELLNGIKDFVEEKNDDSDTPNASRLTDFLENVALSTEMDRTSPGQEKVSLMTIHLAKGLEFPYVYIVGMEENLFPSAYNTNSQTELEEERRLFYVALTRSEKQVYVSYAENRYRWGKLSESEPSRFIDEIDPQYIKHISPKQSYEYHSTIDKGIFDPADRTRPQQTKPKGVAPSYSQISKEKLKKLKLLKPNIDQPIGNNTSPNLKQGDKISHGRFGKGTVLNIEGKGNDKKVEISFENSGIKKLMLRFAKLEKIS